MSIKKELAVLSKKYQVVISYERIPEENKMIAYCDGENAIVLDSSIKNKRTEALCAFFHELGHVHCYRTGKWKAYHDYFTPKRFSVELLRKFIYTALKAERWVDRFAARELLKYDRRIKYDFPFSAERIKRVFLETSVKPVKIKLIKKIQNK